MHKPTSERTHARHFPAARQDGFPGDPAQKARDSAGQGCGVLTRISLRPAAQEVLYGHSLGGVHIDALPVRYDHETWRALFLANWPAGSPAWHSYYRRIETGPDYLSAQARPAVSAASACMIEAGDSSAYK